MKRTEILGVGFDSTTLDEAVDVALTLIDKHNASYVVTPNPEIVMLASEDSDFMSAINDASLVLPDGIGIIYGAKILKTPLKSRIPGIDFASALMSSLAAKGGSVYLFGAKPGVAEKAAENISAKYPGLVICGTHNGYFSDDRPIIDDINTKKPDLLLVCLGAPKQEKWMAANAGKLDIGLMAGLGGSLDVFAGTVKRAPEFFQKAGLEWFYRLCKEPRRIGRMIKLPLFLLEVLKKR